MITLHAPRIAAAALVAALALSGCGRMLPDPEAEARRQDEESAAIGGACKQAGRSVEDCFSLHEGAARAGVIRGWREMDEYMRQNKIDPQRPRQDPAEARPADEAKRP